MLVSLRRRLPATAKLVQKNYKCSSAQVAPVSNNVKCSTEPRADEVLITAISTSSAKGSVLNCCVEPGSGSRLKRKLTS